MNLINHSSIIFLGTKIFTERCYRDATGCHGQFRFALHGFWSGAARLFR
jgi:hypothetical protein